jgi:hypothetical protein
MSSEKTGDTQSITLHYIYHVFEGGASGIEGWGVVDAMIAIIK